MLFRSFTLARLFSVYCMWTLLWGFSNLSLAQEFIVKLKSTPAHFADDLQAFSASTDAKILDAHRQGSLVLVNISQDNTQRFAQTVAGIKENEAVEYLLPNISMYMFDFFDAPNDPLYSGQWALQKVQAEAAWQIHRGNRDVTVAVIDTGIDWGHEDLKAHIKNNDQETPGNNVDDDGNGFVDDIHGWDFKDNDNNPNDETSSKNPGHGTHCAGIIGAVGDNNVGISGIAPQVSLVPVRFLGADGSGDLFTAAKAIDYAVNLKVDVISASWGAAVARDQVKPILEAIERANQAGILFVVAAANNGQSNDTTEVYPANAGLPNVISVAASDQQDGKPQWSNYGRATVDIAAPGNEIMSTVTGSQYRKLSGTSMATPLVAGSVALVLAAAQESGKNLSGPEVKALLQSSGATVAIETACDCRIDVAAALGKLRDNSLVVVPNAATLDEKATKQFSGFGGSGSYSFTSANPAVATIDAKGMLTAVSKGETTITVTDSSGKNAVSKKILVGRSAPPPGNPGNCPLNPPSLCDIMCRIDPQFPWCRK